ncbi:MAG: hypothetical protein Q9O24_13665 [Gammaproteobacteria bacterium]|nr:hypothetical protein [Gammaproteobacteria bacterium]
MQTTASRYKLLFLLPLMVSISACGTLASKEIKITEPAPQPTKRFDSPLEQKVDDVMHCLQQKCEQQLSTRFVLSAMSYDNYYQWARTDIDYLFENAKAQCDKKYQELQWEALKKRMKHTQLESTYNKEGLQMCIQSIASSWRKQHDDPAE